MPFFSRKLYVHGIKFTILFDTLRAVLIRRKLEKAVSGESLTSRDDQRREIRKVYRWSPISLGDHGAVKSMVLLCLYAVNTRTFVHGIFVADVQR